MSYMSIENITKGIIEKVINLITFEFKSV